MGLYGSSGVAWTDCHWHCHSLRAAAGFWEDAISVGMDAAPMGRRAFLVGCCDSNHHCRACGHPLDLGCLSYCEQSRWRRAPRAISFLAAARRHRSPGGVVGLGLGILAGHYSSCDVSQRIHGGRQAGGRGRCEGTCSRLNDPGRGFQDHRCACTNNQRSPGIAKQCWSKRKTWATEPRVRVHDGAGPPAVGGIPDGNDPRKCDWAGVTNVCE